MSDGARVQIWSAGAAEGLAASARVAGWQPVGRDRPAAGALVVIDDRDGTGDAAPAVPGNAGLLVLLAAADPVRQDHWLAAGATQIAVVAADGAGFAQALRLAGRAGAAADRRGGGESAAPALARWIAQRLAAGQAVAVIHVALLRLDLVNAAYGREAGTMLVDAVERRITRQVAAISEDDGTVARVDGAAFVAAVAGASEDAVLAAARIEEALGRRFRLGEDHAVVGARLGFAASRSGDTAATLLARAAAALPPAAAGGDDALAIDVHRALARDEVTLLFQPQAAIDTGAIVGVEALARWRHPERGPLGAAALLAAAGQAGIGTALSEHIQRRVLERVATWPPALAGLRVSLNLTAADLARPGFAETLLAHVDASGVARGRLTLELTETELMVDRDTAAAVLARLQEAGCRTAIDDFGTGYSSLAYLAALPIDYLKIDRSLAQDITGSRRGQVVVRGAIDMARSLGLTVIAEGVETEEQRRALAAAGCMLYQGFLLAEPLDERALVALVER